VRVIYRRDEEKKHSVTYVPDVAKNENDPLGKIYVRKITGLTTSEYLVITVEEHTRA
jgi:hypothetical protein